jgi:hypothetical protein
VTAIYIITSNAVGCLKIPKKLKEVEKGSDSLLLQKIRVWRPYSHNVGSIKQQEAFYFDSI